MLKNIMIFIFVLFGFFQNAFGSENILEKNNADSPYFQIQFQRPSYILENDILDENKEIIYYCDSNKEECKINFKFTKNTGKNLSTTLECTISTDFESEQFKRCNPNTVVFPEGIHKLHIKVNSKKQSENFSERKIIIINGEWSDEEISEVKNELSPSGFQPSPPKGENNIKIIKTPIYSGEAIVKNIISGEVKIQNKTIAKVASPHLISPLGERESTTTKIPDFKYIFQRPSYILETGENNKYTCDTSKGDECKINFKLLTLAGKDISSKLECEIGLDFISSEYKKCNPNTIIFPKGENKVVFRIFEKGNRNNFKEKIVWVENQEIDIKEQDTIQPSHNLSLRRSKTSTVPSSPSGEDTDEDKEKHYLPQTKIAVQGKVSKYKRVGYSGVTCYTYSQCSINFTSGKIYKSKREGIFFKWEFGDGIKYYGYNPKSIKFKPGFYKVKLIVSDDFGNRKVEFYRVKVIKKYKKSDIKNFNKKVNFIANYKTEIYHSINQKYFGFTRKRLSKYKKKGQKYMVKIGNKNIFHKKRKKTPAQSYFKIKKILKKSNTYTRKIKKSLSKAFKKAKKTRKKHEKKRIAFMKKINKLYIKNQKKRIKKLKKAEKLKIKQEKKRITILKKNIKLHISLQSKNLKLSGTTLPYSKVILQIGRQEFKIFANSEGKYELKTHSLQAGVFKITASAYKKGKLVAQKSSRKKIFSQQYISKMKSYLLKKKKKSKKNTSNKSQSRKSKTKKFTIQNYIPKVPPFINTHIFNIKIFLLHIFTVLFTLILGFIILIKRKLI